MAAAELGLSRSRFYGLYTEYLRACAARRARTWVPGLSGGDHVTDWPEEVEPLLRKLLTNRPPVGYSLAASEVKRRLNFALDPASVRRFALAEGLTPAKPSRKAKASVRRWQCAKIGALWQLDATPHRWWPDGPMLPLLNMLDDCSRRRVGAQIYPSESLLAYLDFLPRAFLAHGLPLRLYVDCHSFFLSSVPDALTQLGAALHFYDVSFRYASSPQAKGKIERSHQDWQNRLPPLLSSDGIASVPGANALLAELCTHRDQHERHRELGMTPLVAWQKAQAEQRSALRSPPNALGGLTSSASAPPSKSSRTAGSQPPLSACASRPRRACASSTVFTPSATSPYFAMLLQKVPSLSCSSMFHTPPDLSCFARKHMSRFARLTTTFQNIVDSFTASSYTTLKRLPLM